MSSPTPYPLGRRLNHDPQSRNFPFSARPEAGVEIKSIRWDRQVPIFDQANLGSCTGNAAAGHTATDGRGYSGAAEAMVVALAPSLVPIDEEFAVAIYSAATQIDPFDGSYPPDDTGSDGLSVAKVLQRWGLIDSYTHCFNFQDLLEALQSGPVLVGTNWYTGMFDPDDRGVVTISGEVAGGHEYLAVGVDVDRQELIFTNSWGPGWGDHGFFRMSYATVRRLLSEDGDATVPHPKAVVPEPTPEPVSPPPFSWNSLLSWFRWLWRVLGGRS